LLVKEEEAKFGGGTEAPEFSFFSFYSGMPCVERKERKPGMKLKKGSLTSEIETISSLFFFLS
jgi:hypothetical protein